MIQLTPRGREGRKGAPPRLRYRKGVPDGSDILKGDLAETWRLVLRGLEGFLRGLPDEQRACWVLRELHDLSYAEIAYATNLPVSTVRGRLARARQNLTEGMSAWR